MPPAIVAAGIGAVGAIGGGLIASGGAKSAANAQAQAAREAQAAQEKQFNRQVELQEPFRQGGLTAQSRIFELLGLQDPNARAPSGPAAYGLTEITMPGLGGGGLKIYRDKQGNIVKDINAYKAANPLPAAAPSADFGKYGRDFGIADFEADPGYAFRQSEGMKALERSAAARGNLLSGSSMKGIQRFGQDLASQEYGNAYNRYQINRSNQLNPLQSLMGAGQSSTNTLTNASAQFGNASAQNAMNAGAARASGYVGSANALGGALSSIGQTAAMYPTYKAQNKFMEAQTNYLNSLSGANFSPPSIDQTASYLASTPISSY